MADGVDLFLDHYRAGHDTAVLVCPGFYQHRRMTRCRLIGSAVAAAGYDVLVLDLRGHGQSGGSYTFGLREPDDVRRVLDRVRPQYRRLEILGFSMGAAIAIHALARSRQADGVLAVGAVADPNLIRPWTISWRDALRSCWNWRRGIRTFRSRTLPYGKPRALDVVDRLSPIPMLFVHGARDWLVQPKQSELLYQRAGEPKQLRLIEGGRHAEELFDDDPDGFVRLCTEWFQRDEPP